MAIVKKKQEEETKLNLTVCIITKNDESTIEDCIKSVLDIAREIIVVDIGSTDSTVDIVKQYTNRVYWHKFDNDMSVIRNYFSKLISSEWVLHMEGFEKLAPESKKFFTPKLFDKKNIAYICKVVAMYQDKEVETYTCKMFRRNSDIKFRYTMDESNVEDIQRISRRENLDIIRTEIVFIRYFYLKYFDESELHEERIELAKKGLEDKKISPVIRAYYKLNLALSLNAVGEQDEADDIMSEVLEDIKNMDKKAVYNVPIFMQAYLYFAFKYSKKEKFDEGFEIMNEGIEIYHNSLTMMIRYAEFLYFKEMYQECFKILEKIKESIREETYYILEAIDYELVERLGRKLDKLVKEKLQALEAN